MTDDDIRAMTARRGSPYLVTKEVAAYLRIKVQTLAKMRSQNRGPKFRKDGRFVRYHIADVEAWLKDNPHDRT